MKRDAAADCHAMHAHNEIKPVFIKGSERPSKSGLLRPGGCLADTQGYDLGDMDRNANAIAKPWLRVNPNQTFRSKANAAKTNLSGAEHRAWLNEATTGELYGSSSYPRWNEWGHAVKREMSKVTVHSHKDRSGAWPFKGAYLSPASIYNRLVIKDGINAVNNSHA